MRTSLLYIDRLNTRPFDSAFRIIILGKPSFECLGTMDYPQAVERSASVKKSVMLVLYKSSIEVITKRLHL